MAGIVNKVCCNCYTTHSPQSLCSDKVGVETLVLKSLYDHIEFSIQLMKANPHHRRSTKVEFEFESNYFIHLFHGQKSRTFEPAFYLRSYH